VESMEASNNPMEILSKWKKALHFLHPALPLAVFMLTIFGVVVLAIAIVDTEDYWESDEYEPYKEPRRSPREARSPNPGIVVSSERTFSGLNDSEYMARARADGVGLARTFAAGRDSGRIDKRMVEIKLKTLLRKYNGYPAAQEVVLQAFDLELGKHSQVDDGSLTMEGYLALTEGLPLAKRHAVERSFKVAEELGAAIREERQPKDICLISHWVEFAMHRTSNRHLEQIRKGFDAGFEGDKKTYYIDFYQPPYEPSASQKLYMRKSRELGNAVKLDKLSRPEALKLMERVVLAPAKSGYHGRRRYLLIFELEAKDLLYAGPIIPSGLPN